MDPKAIANRKAGALERIDAGLAVLSSQFKLDAGLGVQLRRTYPDPDLADMRRLEDVADLIEAMVQLSPAGEMSDAVDQVVEAEPKPVQDRNEGAAEPVEKKVGSKARRSKNVTTDPQDVTTDPQGANTRVVTTKTKTGA